MSSGFAGNRILSTDQLLAIAFPSDDPADLDLDLDLVRRIDCVSFPTTTA